MSKERNYTPYINKDGVLENLPKGQSSIDELITEIKKVSPAESASSRTHQAIGTVALAERQTEPPVN